MAVARGAPATASWLRDFVVNKHFESSSPCSPCRRV